MDMTCKIFPSFLCVLIGVPVAVYANASYDIKVVPLDELEIRLPFSVTLPIPYDPSFQNTNSTLYTAFSDAFLQTFRPECLRLRGCLNVAVLAFVQHSTPGSTVMRFEVLFSADVNLAEWKDGLAQALLPPYLVVYVPFFLSVFLDKAEIVSNDVLTTAIGLQAVGRECPLLDPCDSASSCSIQRENGALKSVLCQHKCTGYTCENGGLCFYDRPTSQVACSCTADDTYVYMGPTCSTKIEILSLDSEYIILICAGGGGGVILALLIVICATYYSRWVKPRNRLLRRGLTVAMKISPDHSYEDKNDSRATSEIKEDSTNTNNGTRAWPHGYDENWWSGAGIYRPTDNSNKDIELKEKTYFYRRQEKF